MAAEPSPSFFTISKKISNSTMDVASLKRDSPSIKTTILSRPPPEARNNSWCKKEWNEEKNKGKKEKRALFKVLHHLREDLKEQEHDGR